MPVAFEKMMAVFTAVIFCILPSVLSNDADNERPKTISRKSATDVSPSGSLDIRLHPEEGKEKPPAQALLIDPQGRRTGWEEKTGEIIQEIHGSFYEEERIDDAVEGATGPATRILYLNKAIPGVYRLRIIGTNSYRYSLEVTAFDRSMNFSSKTFRDVEIDKNSTHLYSIEYSGEEDSKVKVQRIK